MEKGKEGPKPVGCFNILEGTRDPKTHGKDLLWVSKCQFGIQAVASHGDNDSSPEAVQQPRQLQ